MQAFRYHDAEPFTQIVALEYAISGAGIIYTGIVPRLTAKVCSQTVLYYAFVYQPFARLMDFVHASSRIRKLYRLSKSTLRFGLALYSNPYQHSLTV
jgi:MFS-type transporter involved in bile tolerance (Atg22 family)